MKQQEIRSISVLLMFGKLCFVLISENLGFALVFGKLGILQTFVALI
jgi:hypothetical protein